MTNTTQTISIPTDGRPLTPEEVVCYCRLDTTGITDPVQAVMRYHKQGRLRGSRIGRRIVFTMKAIHAFLDAQANLHDDEPEPEARTHMTDENL